MWVYYFRIQQAVEEKVKVVEVYSQHLMCCHIRSTMKLSMKLGKYHVYWLQWWCSICTGSDLWASVQQGKWLWLFHHVLFKSLYCLPLTTAHTHNINFHLLRKSASCTHMSALLHALVAMTTAAFQLQPNLLTFNMDEGADVVSMPMEAT